MLVKKNAGSGPGPGSGPGSGSGLGSLFYQYFFNDFSSFLFTQILISRNLHQLCIVTILSSFFRIIANIHVTFQSSSTPISAVEVHK